MGGAGRRVAHLLAEPSPPLSLENTCREHSTQPAGWRVCVASQPRHHNQHQHHQQQLAKNNHSKELPNNIQAGTASTEPAAEQQQSMQIFVKTLTGKTIGGWHVQTACLATC